MQFQPLHNITVQADKKIYFASDFHLGTPNHDKSRVREDTIIRWLDQIQEDAQLIFLLGDLFDFWFEYKYVIPKGFIRFLGKLAALKDQGIDIIIFTGNHDMWMFDYLKDELNIEIIRHPVSITINGQPLHIGHGDGLGEGDKKFKLLKRIFASPLSQKLFAAIHPRWGMGLAQLWSRQSRLSNLKKDESFKGKDHEWIYQYCLEVEKHHHHDYYIFGHRHLPLEIPLHENSQYFNLGEWLSARTYGIHDGKQFQLSSFEN